MGEDPGRCKFLVYFKSRTYHDLMTYLRVLLLQEVNVPLSAPCVARNLPFARSQAVASIFFCHAIYALNRASVSRPSIFISAFGLLLIVYLMT